VTAVVCSNHPTGHPGFNIPAAYSEVFGLKSPYRGRLKSFSDFRQSLQTITMMAVVMEAILLCLLRNKPHLCSLTQHRFIIIQFVTFTCLLHVSTCT